MSCSITKSNPLTILLLLWDVGKVPEQIERDTSEQRRYIVTMTPL